MIFNIEKSIDGHKSSLFFDFLIQNGKSQWKKVKDLLRRSVLNLILTIVKSKCHYIQFNTYKTLSSTIKIYFHSLIGSQSGISVKIFDQIEKLWSRILHLIIRISTKAIFAPNSKVFLVLQKAFFTHSRASKKDASLNLSKMHFWVSLHNVTVKILMALLELLM